MGCNLEKVTEKTLELSKRGKLVPYELSIETVFGCNAKCPMCFIDELPHVKKES